MIFTPDTFRQLILPPSQRQLLVDHCLARLAPRANAGGGGERKAFGLLGGTIADNVVTIRQIFRLEKNVRGVEPHKSFMDDLMVRHAFPSETPNDQRGWVADPVEIVQATRAFREANCQILGTYHMHRLAWPHDPIRDEPTRLDTILGQGSRLLMFIISMVNPGAPIIRCFYEGRTDLELPIVAG